MAPQERLHFISLGQGQGQKAVAEFGEVLVFCHGRNNKNTIGTTVLGWRVRAMGITVHSFSCHE